MKAISHIWSYWSAGGALLVPLAMVSFCILLLVVRTQLAARALLQDGNALQRWLGAHAESMDARSLQRALPVNDFASVFHAALQQIADGQALALEAVMVQENEAMQCLRRDIVLLTALTAAAPLLGLLGTVGGMIATFDAVAAVTGQTGARVAGGISQALITTQFGLVVAMPGVFGLAHIRQLTRDVHLLLGDCRAHVVSMLSARPRAVAKGVRA